jgi:hypothetical protein
MGAEDVSVRRYPLEPFVTVTRWTLSQIQDVAPCNGSEWRQRKALGLTELAADRVACAAGFHPHEIWPEMLDHAIADLPDRSCDECSVVFVPNRPSIQRFCSRRCYRRYHARATERRRRATPEGAARNRDRRRRYYAENAEYERARERQRYRQQRETPLTCMDASPHTLNDMDEEAC